MSALSKRERSIAAKFRRYERVKEQAKRLYDQADGILTEIVKQLEGPKLTKMREEILKAAQSRHSVRIDESGRELHLREASPDEKGILGWGHGAVRQFDPKVYNP